jgi:hypothetical protein
MIGFTTLQGGDPPVISWFVHHSWLVVLTILKNDRVRQWEGLHPIYEMENNPAMFQTTITIIN